MAYVDLNPIRSAMAQTPEASDYTSIQARTRPPEKLPVPLVPLSDNGQSDGAVAPLPIERDAYLQLVDWTGRVVVRGKRSAIPEPLPPILERLAMDQSTWRRSMSLFRRAELRFLGPGDALRALADRLSSQWFKGERACRAVFGST